MPETREDNGQPPDPKTTEEHSAKPGNQEEDSDYVSAQDGRVSDVKESATESESDTTDHPITSQKEESDQHVGSDAVPPPFTEEELASYTLPGIDRIIRGRDYVERTALMRRVRIMQNLLTLFIGISLIGDALDRNTGSIKLDLALISSVPLVVGNAIRLAFVRPHSEAVRRWDDELGTSMYPFVYRGQRHECGRGVTLDKDDLVLMLTPSTLITRGEPSDECIGLQRDILSFALRQALSQIDRSSMVQSRFKAVAISMGGYEEHRAIEALQGLSMGEHMPHKTLFRGKKATSQTPEHEVLLIGIDDLREMLRSEDEILSEAVFQLGDSFLQLNYQALKDARTPEEREKIIKAMMYNVRRRLEAEIEALHYGPEMRRSNSPLEHARERLSGFGQIRESGDILRHTYFREGGEMTTRDISALLQINHHSPTDLIRFPSPQQRARILYVIYEILRNIDPKEARQSQSEVRRDLLRRLKKHKISLSKKEKRRASVTWGEFIKDQVFTYGRSTLIIAMLGLGMTAGALFRAYADHTNLDRLIRRIETYITIPRRSYEQEVEDVDFPSETPKRDLEWSIVEHLTDSRGYFITSTSNDFRDGGWHINSEVQQDLGTSLSDGVSLIVRNKNAGPAWSPLHDCEIRMDASDIYIQLSRSILLSRTEPTIVRVPIRQGMSVHSVAVVDKSQEIMQSTAVLHTDGTISIQIPPVNPKENSNVAIHVVLVPIAQSGIDGVRGLGPVQSARGVALQGETADFIEIQNKVFFPKSTEASPPLSKPEITDSQGSSLLSSGIAAWIAVQHEYSFNPPGKERLNRAGTAEDYISAITEIQGCTCAQCNTGAVLLDNASNNPSPTNIAFGYVIDMPNVEAGRYPLFLTSDTRHAFGITPGGVIIDATPYTIGNDKMTREYFEKKSQGIDFFDEDQLDTYNISKLIAGILIGGASVFTARRVLDRMSRISGKESAASLAREALIKGTSRRDLIRAHNFFGWLCWGDHHCPPDLDKMPSSSATEEELIYTLGDIHEERIAHFILHPTEMMRKAHLSQRQRIKMQLIAPFLFFLR